jgi:hypothetical protein
MDKGRLQCACAEQPGVHDRTSPRWHADHGTPFPPSRLRPDRTPPRNVLRDRPRRGVSLGANREGKRGTRRTPPSRSQALDQTCRLRPNRRGTGRRRGNPPLRWRAAAEEDGTPTTRCGRLRADAAAPRTSGSRRAPADAPGLTRASVESPDKADSRREDATRITVRLRRRKPLDGALRAIPLGRALLREEVSVGLTEPLGFARGFGRKVADHGNGNINRDGLVDAEGLGPTVAANSGPGARGTSVPQPGASAQGSATPQVAKSQEQALDGRSPREHRANVWLQRRTVATDLPADQSLEVERKRKKRRNEATRLRGAEGLRGRRRNNDEKASTAVARFPRPISRFCSCRAGFSRQRGGRDVWSQEAVDAEQLLARGKLRRVERHRGWSMDTDHKPRGSRWSPSGSPDLHGTGRAASKPRSRKGVCGEEVSKKGGFGHPTSRLGEWNGPDDLKLGEPHDRFQGARNLKSARWSKPSKPGGTARTERARRLAASGRWYPRVAWRVPSGTGRAAALRSSGGTGSGHHAPMPMEGRIFDNPMRGAQVNDHNGRTPQGRNPRPVTTTGSANRPCLRRRGEGHEGRAIG